jgi:uncharacterized coiled-coil DUF342 family protein
MSTNSIKFIQDTNNKIPMLLVSESEYTSLVEENKKLKNEIMILYNNEKNLRETIKFHEQTIDELKNENKMLKEELTLLKEHIKKQDEKIKEQDEKIKEQDKTITKLTKKIDDKENKELFKKYIMAIQDINSLDYIETKINSQSKQNLIKLKNNRISECHYLDNTYSQTEINDRRSILLDKIKNMSNEIKQMFDARYPNLLTDIEQFIAPNPTTPIQQVIDDIELWWE